jgi:membrane associated rhomboid family serine protease
MIAYLSETSRIFVITYIIIGITVAVSFLAWDKKTWLSKLAMTPYKIRSEKQYYRMITSAFIHADHTHLLMNMISLYFFGQAVENVFLGLFGAAGSLYFILLYLLAALVSDIPSYHKHKKNYSYSSLGASGAVSAVVFAFILFKPLDNIYLFFVVGLPGFLVGVAYIIYSYYQGKSSRDNINHDAHLYGSLFGLIFCIIIYPQSIPNFFGQLSSWDFFKNIF